MERGHPNFNKIVKIFLMEHGHPIHNKVLKIFLWARGNPTHRLCKRDKCQDCEKIETHQIRHHNYHLNQRFCISKFLNKRNQKVKNIAQPRYNYDVMNFLVFPLHFLHDFPMSFPHMSETIRFLHVVPFTYSAKNLYLINNNYENNTDRITSK